MIFSAEILLQKDDPALAVIAFPAGEEFSAELIGPYESLIDQIQNTGDGERVALGSHGGQLSAKSAFRIFSDHVVMIICIELSKSHQFFYRKYRNIDLGG